MFNEVVVAMRPPDTLSLSKCGSYLPITELVCSVTASSLQFKTFTKRFSDFESIIPGTRYMSFEDLICSTYTDPVRWLDSCMATGIHEPELGGMATERRTSPTGHTSIATSILLSIELLRPITSLTMPAIKLKKATQEYLAEKEREAKRDAEQAAAAAAKTSKPEEPPPKAPPKPQAKPPAPEIVGREHREEGWYYSFTSIFI
ncbi:hypothetical protein KUTeg_004226 [Tegillarca granosa]|uniref:Uncharacterized protein n=1 Tax=Tegillarca granosa TaxID=220873 RepID=A0ABQ9FS86_TEGGR|nr:hypothetical protein KUTeg_004226 [Tegillarca granosa]